MRPTGSPAFLRLNKGFSAFIGVNNSGKSSLLKFFYDNEQHSATMPTGMSVVNQLFSGGTSPYSHPWRSWIATKCFSMETGIKFLSKSTSSMISPHNRRKL